MVSGVVLIGTMLMLAIVEFFLCLWYALFILSPLLLIVVLPCRLAQLGLVLRHVISTIVLVLGFLVALFSLPLTHRLEESASSCRLY